MSTGQVNIRELQVPIKARYRQEPDAAKFFARVKSKPCDLTDPLHCEIAPESVTGLSWKAGAHPGVGGASDVPCSADLLLGALAACQEITLRMVAAAMGIELESLEVEVTGEGDFRGTMGLDREVRVGLSRISCETRVAIKGDNQPERARRLLENAERYCVVLDTLRRGVPVETTFHIRNSGTAY